MDARSSPWEEGTLTVAELGAAQVEADLPGVLNDLRVLGIALGPHGVHGPNTGLVLLGQLVKDTRGPLRPVLAEPPRAATGTGALDKRHPSPVHVVVLDPGGIARTHTPPRVEGPIKGPRVEVLERGDNIPVRLRANEREPVARPGGEIRGAGQPPIRSSLRLRTNRVTGPIERKPPVRPRPRSHRRRGPHSGTRSGQRPGASETESRPVRPPHQPAGGRRVPCRPAGRQGRKGMAGCGGGSPAHGSRGRRCRAG